MSKLLFIYIWYVGLIRQSYMYVRDALLPEQLSIALWHLMNLFCRRCSFLISVNN